KDDPAHPFNRMTDPAQQECRIADKALDEERQKSDCPIDREIHSSDVKRRCKVEQPIKGNVLLQMARERIEGLVDEGLIGDAAGTAIAQSLQIGTAEGVAAEAAMEIGAFDAPIGRTGAVGLAADESEGPGAVGAFRLSEVNFVALDFSVGEDMASIDQRKLFLRGQDRLDIEQTQTFGGCRRALEASGIVNGAAEHLITSANSQ